MGTTPIILNKISYNRTQHNPNQQNTVHQRLGIGVPNPRCKPRDFWKLHQLVPTGSTLKEYIITQRNHRRVTKILERLPII